MRWKWGSCEIPTGFGTASTVLASSVDRMTYVHMTDDGLTGRKTRFPI